MDARRIVFLDIDGTLLDERQVVAPAVSAAIAEARRRGNLVFLCTGRSRAEIPSALDALRFDGVVSAGGGFVDFGDELLVQHPMPEMDVAILVEFFQKHGIDYTLQAHRDAYSSDGHLARVIPLFQHRGINLMDPQEEGARIAARLAPRVPPAGVGIAKAIFFGEDQTTFAKVRDGLSSRYHVITGTIPYLGESGGEVALVGMNKGAAILELLAHLNMTPESAIAIGDSANDIEMLTVVGTGIAMGNADVAVKAIADEITSSIRDDGVAASLIAHGLAAPSEPVGDPSVPLSTGDDTIQ
jgi:Cof subfamily protein (haloacid dehalogenase superfamily)